MIMRPVVRGIDMAARNSAPPSWGLALTTLKKLAERVRQAVAKVTAWLPGGAQVTISIGIASLTAAAREIADLVKQADEALYSAKSLGQNRFVNWKKMPGRTESVGRP